MNITSINSMINFGKKPIMTCCVKQANAKDAVNSTLYKLDCKDEEDIREVKYSKKARCMARDMLRDSNRTQPVHEYYFIKNNKTGEVISCAETSTHYKSSNVNFPGLTTQIDEMAGNEKYIRSEEPMFAFLAHNSAKRFIPSVTMGCYTENSEQLKQARFSQTKNGDWVLPEKRYESLIKTATKHSGIEFLC